MVLRALFRYLVNNEYLIEQINLNSKYDGTCYEWIVFEILIGEEGMEKLKNSDTLYQIEDKLKHAGRKVSSVGTSFSEELRKGLKQMNEEIQRRQKS